MPGSVANTNKCQINLCVHHAKHHEFQALVNLRQRMHRVFLRLGCAPSRSFIPRVELGRAGLEALPLRARKILSFSHDTSKTHESHTNLHACICSQSPAKSPDPETLYKGHSRFFDLPNAPARLRIVWQKAGTCRICTKREQHNTVCEIHA